MKTVFALFLLILVTSCAHNKIRLVKQPKHQIVKVEPIESQSNDVAEIEEAPEVQEPQNVAFTQNTSQEETVAEGLEDEDEYEEEEEEEISSASNWNAPAPTDSTKQVVVDVKQLNKETEARISEDDAKMAKNLMIGAFVSVPFAIIGGLGLLASIVFFIAGSIMLKRANKYRYTTVDGTRYMKNAKLMQTLWIIGASILVAAAIVLLIVLLV